MKRLVCLLLLLSLCCSGCSTALEQDLRVSVPVEPQVQLEDDPSILRAENYEALVSSLIYFVEQVHEQGTIRLYNYKDDVETDLRSARYEVEEVDPLGAYAVEYISTEFVNVVSYYEVTVYIRYRRSAEQIASVRRAIGAIAMRQEMESALKSYQSELVLQVSSFYNDTESITELLYESYESLPEYAMGEPTLSISFYPQDGGSYGQPIVEILMEYPHSAEEMLEKAEELERYCLSLDLSGIQGSADPLAAAHEYYAAHVNMVAEGEWADSAYGAFVLGEANGRGFELGWRLLCTLLELEYTPFTEQAETEAMEEKNT